MDKIISIIITNWYQDEERSKIMKESLSSLVHTTRNMPVEIIVIDNGENYDDSEFLLAMAHNKDIQVYLRNANNMHFAYARNQALKLCNGDYICISDNDIIFKEGWLEKCINILEELPNEKIYATPVYNVAHYLPKYWSSKTFNVDGDEIRLNSRAGSNIFVMRRKDFEEVGDFLVHRVAGTKWTEEAIQKGYMAAVLPIGMVKDEGFRQGYNTNDYKPVKLVLTNKQELYFNQDEFKRLNKNLRFRSQKYFQPKKKLRWTEE